MRGRGGEGVREEKKPRSDPEIYRDNPRRWLGTGRTRWLAQIKFPARYRRGRAAKGKYLYHLERGTKDCERREAGVGGPLESLVQCWTGSFLSLLSPLPSRSRASPAITRAVL